MLDGIIEALGLIRIKRYDDMKDKLNLELELTHGSLREQRERVQEFEHKIEEGDAEAKARWTSPDGKRVLKDLQRSLNYLRDYQRALWILLAPDNNYYLVTELLKAWGMEPHSQVNDFYARSNPGVPKRDRTGQEYDSYGILFIQPDTFDGRVRVAGDVHTYEDIDPNDPDFKTDLTISPTKLPLLLESGDED